MNDSEDLVVLLSLSKKMLAACECNDWPEVTALEQQRALLIKQIFNENILPATRSDISSNLTALIAINQAIQSKSEAARQDLLCQLGNLKRIHKVVDAYTVD